MAQHGGQLSHVKKKQKQAAARRSSTRKSKGEWCQARHPQQAKKEGPASPQEGTATRKGPERPASQIREKQPRPGPARDVLSDLILKRLFDYL